MTHVGPKTDLQSCESAVKVCEIVDELFHDVIPFLDTEASWPLTLNSQRLCLSNTHDHGRIDMICDRKTHAVEWELRDWRTISIELLPSTSATLHSPSRYMTVLYLSVVFVFK